jgi:hypothetical protein
VTSKPRNVQSVPDRLRAGLVHISARLDSKPYRGAARSPSMDWCVCGYAPNRRSVRDLDERGFEDTVPLQA